MSMGGGVRTVAAGLGMLLALSASTSPLEAQDEEVLQLSLFNPVQIYPETAAIRVFRFNLLYGKNVWVRGLDVGLANHTTGGISKGLQHGIVGVNEGDFLGWQHNYLVNMTEGVMTGLQTGAFNQAGGGEVVQIGVVNVAENVSGFQLGFVNITDDLYGLQIGLVNIIRNKETLPFFPIVNWRF